MTAEKRVETQKSVYINFNCIIILSFSITIMSGLMMFRLGFSYSDKVLAYRMCCCFAIFSLTIALRSDLENHTEQYNWCHKYMTMPHRVYFYKLF